MTKKGVEMDPDWRAASEEIRAVSEARERRRKNREEPKPCPFCGARAEIAKVVGPGVDAWHGYCGRCWSFGPLFADKGDATEAWNRRVA